MARETTSITSGEVLKKDYYVGRPVIGSEPLVGALQERLPEVRVFNFNGQLMYPLMRQHRLAGRGKALARAAVRALPKRLEAGEVSELETESCTSTKNPTGKQGFWLVKFVIADKDPIMKQLHDETAAIGNELAGPGSKPLNFFANPYVRVCRTPDEEAAITALKMMIINYTAPTLTLGEPQVCFAPSENKKTR